MDVKNAEHMRALIKQDEDRQAVRVFRFIFNELVALEHLSNEQQQILATGIVNMTALSELGRNEKNYLPDVNAMINSIMTKDNQVVFLLRNFICAINQEFWITAIDVLDQLDKELKAEIFTIVGDKCRTFLKGKYEKLSVAHQKSKTHCLNPEKTIQEVKELVDKQQKLI